MKKILKFLQIILIISIAAVFLFIYAKHAKETEILKQIIKNLQADSRAAQVLVTAVNYNEKTQKTLTTIKFLEYDSRGNPLNPKYFTFTGNIIQFQALVIRFDDIHIRIANKLKGKSAYIFLKVFMLDGKNTQEYIITEINQVPEGYKISKAKNNFEQKLWLRFWEYALKDNKLQHKGIKNAQIEAPGTMFLPGMLYTIKIEHGGGLRIDAEKLPGILKGEHIPK